MMAARDPQKPKYKPLGQPTKYRPDCCAIAVAKGQEGASKTEIAVACGASRKTLDYWREKHPEFDEAMAQAEMHAQVWWEQRGRGFITGQYELQKGAGAVFIFQMKNRFPDDYRDRHEITGKDGGPIQSITTTMTAEEAERVYRERMSGR